MAANLTYTITSGFPNFTVHLDPQIVDDQIQTSTGTFTMTNIPDGTYTLTITDVYDCVFTIFNIMINTSVTTTTSTTLPITTTTTTTACSRPSNLTFKWFVYFIYTVQVPAGYNITATLTDAVNSVAVLASDLTSALLEGVDAINYNVGSVMYVHNSTTDCQKVTDGYYSSWNGQKCSYDVYHVVSGVIVSITHNPSCIGLLYNAYTTNSLEIISGWKVPTLTDWQTLITTLGTDYSVTHNNALKETGLVHWNSPNLGATNTTNFYADGGGYRDNLGVFSGIKDYGYWYSFDSGTANYISMTASGYLISNSNSDYKFGFSIRLLKNNSTDPGTVTDYDGNVYVTVTIGSQVWMAENLKTQHFSNGTAIPYLPNATDWASTILPALCPYNNDWVNNSCTTQIISITTTTTTTVNIYYQCHVLYNDASGYLWEYLTPDGSNTTVSVISSGLDLSSFNIAMTENRLWTYNLTPGGTNSIFEYNISFSPWSISSSRTITYTIPATGSAPKGLCAMNNNTLIVGGIYSSTGAYGDIYGIYQLDITSTNAAPTKMFDLYAGFNVTGDILYLSSRNTIIIALYYNNTTSDLRIGEFSTTGLALHEVVIPNYPTGLYLYNNNVYTIDSSGTVYLFDIVNYTYTYKTIIPNNLGIIGADSNCISTIFPVVNYTITVYSTVNSTGSAVNLTILYKYGIGGTWSVLNLGEPETPCVSNSQQLTVAAGQIVYFAMKDYPTGNYVTYNAGTTDVCHTNSNTYCGASDSTSYNIIVNTNLNVYLSAYWSGGVVICPTLPITTTTTTTIASIIIACGVQATYPGGQAYPTSHSITLGSDYGTVNLNYDMAQLPDQALLYFDGALMINTGYRGEASYDFGGSNRLTFKNSLNGKIDPVGTPRTIIDPILGTIHLPAIYPNFTLYPDDGYPRILGTGIGTASFYKNSTTTTATVNIYSPLPGTIWQFSLTCPTPIPLKICDLYGGGCVAYILQPSDAGYDANYYKGLIVATEDQSTSCTWWNGVNTVTGTGSAPKDTFSFTAQYGVQNTTDIINSQGNTGAYAAKLCRDYRGGGYTDWFLPNLDELNYVWSLYVNFGCGNLTNGASYWASNEWDADTKQAWSQYFGLATTYYYVWVWSGLLPNNEARYNKYFGPRYKLPKSVNLVGSNTPYWFWINYWPQLCIDDSCVPSNSKIINPTCYARACRYFSVLKTDLYSINTFYVRSSVTSLWSSSGGPINTQYSGVAFTIKLTAIDGIGNIVAYTGTADITSTGPLYGGNFTTGSFINGVLTVSITFDISANGNYTITATKTGGSNAGTSNTFSVINTIN